MDLLAPIMKFFNQLGFLRVALGPSRRTEAEEGRVLHLFRNRAELKKAYSGTQDELLRTKDRVKQQEGATARVQEMLSTLEARLGRPETAYPALVFYQLRDLWKSGHTLLEQLLVDLVGQREERERRQFLAEYNRQQFARRQAVEALYVEAEGKAASERGATQELERALAERRSFWHYFTRRKLRRQLQAASLRALLSEQELDTARQGRDAVLAEPEPEFPGLSFEARRAINLATIAYAQVLCDRLARTGLLQLASEASGRREPPSDDYGDRAGCERLIQEIQAAKLVLQQRQTLKQEVSEQVETLKGRARYREATDTLPQPESLTTVEALTSCRVLVDDTWEVYHLLLR
ncbi:MAG TPA: hypothetical protein VKG66_04265 [Steroidobacteraceae bacterium]|nr:hypothetical protein [Steroidobacteraceae bacterium]